MTLWPRERASRAIYLPKPLEAAVMNQTGVCDVMIAGEMVQYETRVEEDYSRLKKSSSLECDAIEDILMITWLFI